MVKTWDVKIHISVIILPFKFREKKNVVPKLFYNEPEYCVCQKG